MAEIVATPEAPLFVVHPDYAHAAPANLEPLDVYRERYVGAKPTHVVAHNVVGGWYRGDLIGADDLKGVDVPRLVALGAVLPLAETAAKKSK